MLFRLILNLICYFNCVALISYPIFSDSVLCLAHINLLKHRKVCLQIVRVSSNKLSAIIFSILNVFKSRTK